MKQASEFGQALYNFTNDFANTVLTDIRGRAMTETNEPDRFYYTVLHKMNAGLNTCAVLVMSVESKYHFADSIFVVLRSLISDSVMFYHIMNKSKGNDNERKQLITSLYIDHFMYTLRDEKFIAQLEGITLDEARIKILEIKNDYPDYFHADGTPKADQWKTTVKGALQFAWNHGVDEDLCQHLQVLFHYYELFSKFEHLGHLTFDLIHRQYSEKNLNRVVFQIMDSILSLIPTYHHALDYWPDVKQSYGLTFYKFVEPMLSIQKE